MRSNPLISIIFNGKITNEFYLLEKNQTIYLKLETKLGKNILEISTLNNKGSITVKKIRIYK
jgi:hypothetical protein